MGPEEKPRQNEGVELAAELAAAIEQDVLELYFQPIVSLADRSVTMLEALSRWPHPQRGMLAPADFIATAEHSDLLPALERWAIDAAFRQLRQWSRGVSAQMSIFLNLSEEHVFHGDLAGVVERAAEESGVSAERIGFEISEATLIEAGGRSIDQLLALSKVGPTLTVDDYTGSISTSLLQDLPIAALKISRHIVEAIPDDSRRLESAVAAARRGSELGVMTIAGGVENPGQLAALRNLGCGYAQGFFFSVPMPARALAERMTRR